MCPIVPIFRCGLLRSNFSFAIAVSAPQLEVRSSLPMKSNLRRFHRLRNPRFEANRFDLLPLYQENLDLSTCRTPIFDPQPFSIAVENKCLKSPCATNPALDHLLQHQLTARRQPEFHCLARKVQGAPSEPRANPCARERTRVPVSIRAGPVQRRCQVPSFATALLFQNPSYPGGGVQPAKSKSLSLHR